MKKEEKQSKKNVENTSAKLSSLKITLGETAETQNRSQGIPV
jgi:hypothetical protein